MPDNVSLSGIPNFRLEVFENTGSAADCALSGRGLDHQFLHNAILCDERKALTASSHPETGSIEEARTRATEVAAAARKPGSIL